MGCVVKKKKLVIKKDTISISLSSVHRVILLLRIKIVSEKKIWKIKNY